MSAQSPKTDRSRSLYSMEFLQDVESLHKERPDLFHEKRVLQWDREQVVYWLVKNALGAIAWHFWKIGVNGEELLHKLDYAQLVAMKVPKQYIGTLFYHLEPLRAMTKPMVSPLLSPRNVAQAQIKQMQHEQSLSPKSTYSVALRDASQSVVHIIGAKANTDEEELTEVLSVPMTARSTRNRSGAVAQTALVRDRTAHPRTRGATVPCRRPPPPQSQLQALCSPRTAYLARSAAGSGPVAASGTGTSSAQKTGSRSRSRRRVRVPPPPPLPTPEDHVGKDQSVLAPHVARRMRSSNKRHSRTRSHTHHGHVTSHRNQSGGDKLVPTKSEENTHGQRKKKKKQRGRLSQQQRQAPFAFNVQSGTFFKFYGRQQGELVLPYAVSDKAAVWFAGADVEGATWFLRDVSSGLALCDRMPVGALVEAGGESELRMSVHRDMGLQHVDAFIVAVLRLPEKGSSRVVEFRSPPFSVGF